mmetsp:Transcript_29482/g.66070  ORF Transcript_29482/g.66070 Transcript_29482/m.66070 type:complete len:262 (-) Transcript_29482:603-1388(-)
MAKTWGETPRIAPFSLFLALGSRAVACAVGWKEKRGSWGSWKAPTLVCSLSILSRCAFRSAAVSAIIQARSLNSCPAAAVMEIRCCSKACRCCASMSPSSSISFQSSPSTLFSSPLRPRVRSISAIAAAPVSKRSRSSACRTFLANLVLSACLALTSRAPCCLRCPDIARRSLASRCFKCRARRASTSSSSAPSAASPTPPLLEGISASSMRSARYSSTPFAALDSPPLFLPKPSRAKYTPSPSPASSSLPPTDSSPQASS